MYQGEPNFSPSSLPNNAKLSKASLIPHIFCMLLHFFSILFILTLLFHKHDFQFGLQIITKQWYYLKFKAKISRKKKEKKKTNKTHNLSNKTLWIHNNCNEFIHSIQDFTFSTLLWLEWSIMWDMWYICTELTARQRLWKIQ